MSFVSLPAQCVWKAVPLLSLLCLSAFFYCLKPVRTFLLQTHQVNLLPLHWSRAAVFPLKYGKYTRVSAIRSCSNQVTFFWPLNQTLQETPRDTGNSWGCAASGVMGDEGTEHLRKGMASVISLSLSLLPAEQPQMFCDGVRAPEPQAQRTVTDQIHLSLLCFLVGSSWFLVQAHFLQNTCWGHEVTAPINQQKPNTLIQEQKEVFS